jgi:hypothetical protein
MALVYEPNLRPLVSAMASVGTAAVGMPVPVVVQHLSGPSMEVTTVSLAAVVFLSSVLSEGFS